MNSERVDVAVEHSRGALPSSYIAWDNRVLSTGHQSPAAVIAQ